MLHAAIVKGAFDIASAVLDSLPPTMAARYMTEQCRQCICVTPSAEYIDFVCARSGVRSLVLADHYTHQACRLLAAISLRHAAAIDWVRAVDVDATTTTFHWRFAPSDAVTTVSASMMMHFVNFASTVGNVEFIAAARAWHATALTSAPPTVFLYNVDPKMAFRCPFTDRKVCCRR
jgi:hypothetical protein